MIELPALFLANLAGALPFHYRRKQYNSSKKHDPSLHRKRRKKTTTYTSLLKSQNSVCWSAIACVSIAVSFN